MQYTWFKLREISCDAETKNHPMLMAGSCTLLAP
jgi:hypothetical protein